MAASFQARATDWPTESRARNNAITGGNHIEILCLVIRHRDVNLTVASRSKDYQQGNAQAYPQKLWSVIWYRQ